MSKNSNHNKGIQLLTQIDDIQLSYDVEAFDNLIRSSGTTLVHYRAMRCPVGMVDKHDIRHPQEDHDGCCSNGFIYHKVGKVTGFFQSNTTGPFSVPEGLLHSSSSMITFPRFYDETKNPVIVAPYDKLYLDDPELVVVTWEIVQAHSSGVDRTQYPVVCVEHLVDSRQKEYKQGKDFDIVSGKIAWKGQNQPGVDPVSGRGTVYSIRYRYLPHFFVRDLVHEIRVMPATDPATMKRTMQRLPYLIRVQREYVFLSQQRDEAEDSNPGASRAPADGGNLGPR